MWEGTIQAILGKLRLDRYALKKPPVYSPETEGETLAHIWETPVVVVGHTWLPLAELASWVVFSWWSSRRNPASKPLTNLGMGAIHTLTTLGSEWCHNLAHVAASKLVDRPMDALRITWGMPLCVYYELEDARVTPRQHIARALGGPLFNLAAAFGLGLVRPITRASTPAREIVDRAIGANIFILGAGLLPYPGLDGGVILKWSLVEGGSTPKQADLITRGVDGAVAAGLAGAAMGLRKRRPWLSLLLAVLSALGLGFALGLVREA